MHSPPSESEKDSAELARELNVSGLVTQFAAPGLALLGVVFGIGLAPELFTVLFGASMLVGYVGAGLLAAAFIVKRRPGPRAGQFATRHGREPWRT